MALNVLNTICTRLCLGHGGVLVGDNLVCSEENVEDLEMHIFCVSMKMMMMTMVMMTVMMMMMMMMISCMQ